MMEKFGLKETGISDLREISKIRRLYVFGAGRVMRRVMQSYARFGLEKYVRAIIDNNEALWGTTTDVNGTELRMISLSRALEEIGDAPAAIAVFVKDSDDIAEQLQQSCAGKDVLLFSYPKCICTDEQKWTDEFLNSDLEDRIVMQGEGDNRENALAVFEYLKENDLIKKYNVVWICDHPEKAVGEEGVSYIKRNLMQGAPTPGEIYEYLKVIKTSRYFFYENINMFKERPDQVTAYMKHGTFPLKNVKGVLWVPDDVDRVICTSENYADLVADMEGTPKEKLMICGSPRLDFLYKDKHVLETLNKAEKGCRYILWLPTLRQTHGRNDMKSVSPFGIPLINRQDEFDRLDAFLGEKGMKLIIKPHPHQDLSVYKIGSFRNILFITQSELDEHDLTIHSLMRETVGLISDYSSVAFDYMLLDRPIAYTVDDMDDYKIGFSVEDPMHFMPGQKLKTVDDMLEFIENVVEGTDPFRDERHEIRDYIHHYQDDRNAERFLKMMGMI